MSHPMNFINYIENLDMKADPVAALFRLNHVRADDPGEGLPTCCGPGSIWWLTPLLVRRAKLAQAPVRLPAGILARGHFFERRALK